MTKADLPAPGSGQSRPTDVVPGISVVVVTHNSAHCVEQCLSSIAQQLHPHEVIVIDNASSDGSATTARRALPDALVIESTLNLGFGRACNLGVEHARCDTVMFVNPDVGLSRVNRRDLDRVLSEPSLGLLVPLLSTAPNSPPPALLTSTSTPPSRSAAAATASAHCRASRRSRATAVMFDGHSSTSDRSDGSCRAVATTWSPACAAATASARPSPDEHPVTSQRRATAIPLRLNTAALNTAALNAPPDGAWASRSGCGRRRPAPIPYGPADSGNRTASNSSTNIECEDSPRPVGRRWSGELRLGTLARATD